MRLFGSWENDYLLEMSIVENYFEFRNVRGDDQSDKRYKTQLNMLFKSYIAQPIETNKVVMLSRQC